MKKPLFKWMMAVALVSLVATSCSKDDDDDNGNEEELITTLEVTTVEFGSARSETFIFKDLDGPGGAGPSEFDSIILNSNKAYSVSLRFLNETETPVEDVTVEVVAEANDHQVYYEASSVNIQAVGLNNDPRGLPLGTTCTWNTGGPAKGNLKITLKHKPGIKASGDPVSKGETDIEVNFGARLQ